MKFTLKDIRYEHGIVMKAKKLVSVSFNAFHSLQSSIPSLLFYLEFGYTIHSQGHSRISAAPELPQLARQTHTLKLAIENEILDPGQSYATRYFGCVAKSIGHYDL
jgi:hypothetical protein